MTCFKEIFQRSNSTNISVRIAATLIDNGNEDLCRKTVARPRWSLLNCGGYAYLLTYLLIPWSRIPLEKLTGFQEIPRILWNPNHHCIHKCPPPVSVSLWTFRNNMLFLWWGVVSTSLNFKVGRSPLVGCLPLLIQYIRSCPSYWR